MAVLNNKTKDQLFLQACFDNKQDALDHWGREYWREVAHSIKEVLSRYSYNGLVDDKIRQELTVDCTEAIYEQYQSLPSHFFSLKTQVRKYALAYAKKYLKDGGRLTITP